MVAKGAPAFYYIIIIFLVYAGIGALRSPVTAHVTCAGGIFALAPAAMGTIFGVQYLGPNYGALFLANGGASLLGALISEVAMDRFG